MMDAGLFGPVIVGLLYGVAIVALAARGENHFPHAQQAEVAACSSRI